jgi:multisubunit Na+/H+ antiporter MnhB subunit
MSEDQGRLPNGPQRKSSLLNIITWVGIGLILILIAAWTVWAGHQPDLHSIWVPD